MKIVKNQKGLTLIEVLATLAIISLLIGVVYGVLINGLNYSSRTKDTVAIQQEANYLITLLKGLHEKEGSYSITVETDHTAIFINKGTPDERIIENPNYYYKMCNLDDSTKTCDEQYTSQFSIRILNTNTESFHVKIVVINRKNPNLTYTIQTILSRL